MKVLVLGGTGAMGHHLVEQLAAAGAHVCATSRTQKASTHTTRWIQGNPHNNAFMEEILLTKWDVIVDFMIYSTEQFKSRIERFLRATDQYIYLSSARVYADSGSIIHESSPRLLDVCRDKKYITTDEYALSKARQENILFDSSSSNWTIVRPYITFSENRLQLGSLEKEGWLYRALRGRPIVFCSDIAPRATTLTYGKDVAAAIASLLGVPAALREVFHVTAPTSATWNEVLQMYSSVLEMHTGRPPRMEFQDLDNFIRWQSAPYQVLFDRLFDRRFDNSKISRYIGKNHFQDPLTGLRDCMQKFLCNPAFQQLDWKREALKDRASHTHTSLREIGTFRQRARYLKERFF